MVKLYWIAFVPPLKSYRIGILFTHMNGDFDAISMTEGNCVTTISKGESHVLDKLQYVFIVAGQSLSCPLTFYCFSLPSFYVLFSNPIEMK